ncbi:MAG: hypothetical protein K8H74_15230, partial [Notoacmeibacter sp.]|nr:hypothetical protein [Notoacmeibacter sp.]
TAAEDRSGTLLDHLMDMDLPPSPRVPWIKKLALNAGPVGVPSLSCTTTSGLMPPMADSRPPWSTSPKSKPISRSREQLKKTGNLSNDRGLPHSAIGNKPPISLMKGSSTACTP